MGAEAKYATGVKSLKTSNFRFAKMNSKIATVSPLTTTVWPSAVAVAAAAMPMVVPAPPLFSTITGLPSW
ncbi:hypothetical protein D9M68_1001740 [compost metagenome]